MDLDNLYICTDQNCWSSLTLDGIESHIFLRHSSSLVPDSHNKENKHCNKSADQIIESSKPLSDADALTYRPKQTSKPPTSSRIITFHRSKIKKFNEIRSTFTSFLTSSKQLYTKEIMKLEAMRSTFEEERKRQDELYREYKEKLLSIFINFFADFEKMVQQKRKSASLSEACTQLFNRLDSERQETESVLSKLSDRSTSIEKIEIENLLQRFATNSFNLNQTKLFSDIDSLALKLKNQQLAEKIEVDESRINAISAEVSKYLRLGGKGRAATPLITKLSPVVLPMTPSGLRKNLSITIESPATTKKKSPKHIPSYFSSKKTPEIIENALHAFEEGTNTLHVYKIESAKGKLMIHRQTQALDNKEYIIPANHRSLKTSVRDIILTGGIDSSTNSILNICYKLASSRNGPGLEEIAPMTRGRHSHGLVELAGYIYAVGGIGNKGDLAHCERLNCEKLNGKWEGVAEVNLACYDPTLCAVNNTAIYKLGGYIRKGRISNKIEKYSLDDNHWFMINFSCEDSKFDFFSLSGAVQLNESQIIVFGGRDEKDIEQRSAYYFHINDDSTKEDEETPYHISAVSKTAIPWADSFTANQIFYQNEKLLCLSREKQTEILGSEVEFKEEEEGFKVVLYDHVSWSIIDTN